MFSLPDFASSHWVHSTVLRFLCVSLLVASRCGHRLAMNTGSDSRAATWSLKSSKVPFLNTWSLMSLNLKKWSLKSLFLCNWLFFNLS